MSLRLYNTRTQAVEPFVPADAEHVRMYVCGLTPSAEAHLGHARSFLFFDVLRRYLVHLGYRVTYVRNVTDIDDRSIAAAHVEGVAFGAVIARHMASFEQSMNRLGVIEPDREPRATAYVAEIVAMIAGLIDGGHAYAAADGVYYAVRSFRRYGALARRNTDELLVGARIAPGEDKRDPLDFALWKFARPGEPAWPSPWGDGRPGWHIECSAMSHALLGEPLDIHGGGYDLIFPHHENEIAQSEALYGAPLARWWVHGGLLQFDGKKMSKSLGNFEPLSALLDRHDPQAIRLSLLQAGYRKPMNFTEAALDAATSGLRRLQEAYDLLRGTATNEKRSLLGAVHASDSSARAAAKAVAVVLGGEAIDVYRSRFFDALDDDMNTAGAVGALFELAADAPALLENGLATAAAGFIHEALGLLGLSPNERAARAVPISKMVRTPSEAEIELQIRRHKTGPAEPTQLLAHREPGAVDDPRLGEEERAQLAARLGPDFVAQLREQLAELVSLDGLTAPDEAIEAVIDARTAARKARDFALADRLRSALVQCGVTLADSKEGVTWSAGA